MKKIRKIAEAFSKGRDLVVGDLVISDSGWLPITSIQPNAAKRGLHLLVGLSDGSFWNWGINDCIGVTSR